MSDLLLRFKWPIVASLCAVAVVSCILLARDRLDDPTQLVVNSADEAPADIRVYVTGAVQRPGVYPLSSNARWIDALEAAGGATADADLTAVNLSLRVKDEDQIVVPQLGQSPALLVAGAASTPSLININLADQEELESLPGIGEVRASRIIASREAEGPFTQPEDLLLRDIVPDSVYEDIEPLITVN